MLIAGFGNAVAADYAAFVSQSSQSDAVVVADEKIRRLVEAPVRSLSMDEFLRSTPDIGSEHGQVSSLILFINSRLTARERRELDDILRIARRWQTRFVGIVSTFRVHLDDPDVAEVENYVLSRASDLPARVVVFRPGHVLSRHSSISRFLERFAPFYPLIPERLSSCFIEGTEFFAAIEAERLEERRRADPRDAMARRGRDRDARTPPVDPWVVRIGPTRSWARIDPGATCSFAIEWRRPAIPDDSRQHASFLAVGRPGDRARLDPARPGAFHGCDNGMSRL